MDEHQGVALMSAPSRAAVGVADRQAEERPIAALSAATTTPRAVALSVAQQASDMGATP
jgi:hypothetical protein